MTESEKIEMLARIYNKQLNIGYFYSNESLKSYTDKPINISLDDYVSYNSFTLDTTKTLSVYESIKYFNLGFFQIIDMLQKDYDDFLNGKQLEKIKTLSTGCINLTSKLFRDLSSESVNSNIDNLMSPWLTIAEEKTVNIDDEIKSLATIKNKLKILDNMESLFITMGDINLLANELLNDDLNVNLVKELKSSVFTLQDDIDTQQFKDIHQYFNHANIPAIFNELLQVEKSIQNKLLENGLSFSLADTYTLENNKNSIKSFMINKDMTDLIKFSIKLDKSPKYEEFILFNDNSIVVKKNNGSIESINNHSNAKIMVADFFKDFVETNLRKKPTISKFFVEELTKNEGYNYEYLNNCYITMNTFLDNEDILKQCKFSFNDIKSKDIKVSTLFFDQLTEGSVDTSFEYIDDKMNKLISEHKFKKFAHSISSHKYSHLYDNKSYEILKELFDAKVSESVLQDFIGKKMAVFKNQHEFNYHLTKMYDSINGFNLDDLLEKGLLNKATLIAKEDNLLIFEITNFEQSKNMGSASWCISRDSHYFNSYTSNGNHQYFIYDFSKTSKDPESILGITLNENGAYHTAYQKNDEVAEHSNIIYHLQLKILKNSLPSYPNLEDSLKNDLDKIEKALTKIKTMKNVQL